MHGDSVTPFVGDQSISSSRPELLNPSYAEPAGGEVRGDVGLNSILTVCCSHCHCSRQSVMAIGQSWLADDDGYDTSTPYYHSSVYGWYNGFVWWVRFLSTLHLLHREEELRSMGKVFFRPSTASVCFITSGVSGFDHWTHPWPVMFSLLPRDSALYVKATSGYWSCCFCNRDWWLTALIFSILTHIGISFFFFFLIRRPMRGRFD